MDRYDELITKEEAIRIIRWAAYTEEHIKGDIDILIANILDADPVEQ